MPPLQHKKTIQNLKSSMDEDFQWSLSKIMEAISAGKISCSPEFVADIANLESEIRDLDIENNINRIRLQEWLNKIPLQDRKELGDLLDAQID